MYYRKTSPFICQEGHSRTVFADSCPVVRWRLLKSPLPGHGWATVGSLGRKRGLELGLQDLASRKTGCPYVSYILSGKHYWNSSWTPRWAKDWKRKKRSGMVGSSQFSRFAGSLLFSVLEVSPQDLGLTLSLSSPPSNQYPNLGIQSSKNSSPFIPPPLSIQAFIVDCWTLRCLLRPDPLMFPSNPSFPMLWKVLSKHRSIPANSLT